MAITNGYCTLAEFKSRHEIGSTMDTTIENTIEAVSRQIDRYCGRTFYQRDATTLVFDAEFSDMVFIDDLYNTTGLTVATDTSGNGTFDESWTITTDFILGPTTRQPGWPFQSIHRSRYGSKLFPRSMAAVEVTGNFGWAAIPDDIREACLLLANRSLHRRVSPEGFAGSSEWGMSRISRFMDSDATNYLNPFRRMVFVG